MAAVHEQVLGAALALTGARRKWTFAIADLVRTLPHLNPGTVRTHVASRCCTNAPANHQSRHPYFRALGAGRYRIEQKFRKAIAPAPRQRGWQDRVLEAMDSGIDPTLIAESLKLSPTERLEMMRAAADSIERMRSA